MASIKNADKQTIGTLAYDIVNNQWGTITSINKNETITLKDDNSKWDTFRENVYPIVKDCTLNVDNSIYVCYEVATDLDYPYYVPEYDDNFYEFEVTHNEKGKDPTEVSECYLNNMVDTLCKSIATDLTEIADVDYENRHSTIYEYFLGYLKEIAKNNKADFIKKYVGYDADEVYAEIASALTDSAFTILVPCKIAEKMDTNVREAIADKVNSLPLAELIHIDNTTSTDSVYLTDVRKRLDIERYVHPKRKYDIEAIITSKYLVKVEAENLEKAKDIAWELLNKYPIMGQKEVQLIESEPKIKRWDKNNKENK